MKQEVSLKEVALHSKGQQINGDELILDGEYSYLNGGINPSGKWNDYNVMGESITISEGGNSCGYVNYMKEPFWCGAHCYYLYQVRGNVKYLYYALKSQQEKVMKLRSGACMPNIKKSDLAEFRFLYDNDIEEQKKIVTIMDGVTSIVEFRKAQLLELEKLIKSRFVEMFGSCNNWMTMDKLCSIITDGTHQPPKFQNSGIPFLFVSNLAENKVTYNTEKYISEETYQELYRRTPIEKGDLLLTTVGSYGHPAVVVEEKKFLFQRHIAYLKPKQELVNSYYLHGALLSPDGQRQIEEKVKGIAQKTLNLSEIRKIMIPVPNMEQQEGFATFIAQVDKLKLEVQKSLDETQQLMDSLMQKYFG